MSTDDRKQTVTASDVCRIAGIDQGTLRVWKSRWRAKGVDLLPESGAGWTRYSFKEVMILTIVARLAEIGLPVHQAKVSADAIVLDALKRIRGFKDDTAYLVLSTGELGEVIPQGGGKPRPVTRLHIPGAIFPKTVRGRDLAQILADPRRYASVVVNLNEIEKHVEERWPEGRE